MAYMGTKKTVYYTDVSTSTHRTQHGARQSERCMQSLDTIAEIGDLIDDLTRRLYEKSREFDHLLAVSRQREEEVRGRISELETVIKTQDEEYLKLAAVLEAKLIECEELKANFDLKFEEHQWAERHIRAVTQEINDLKSRLRITSVNR
ncbi:hypothetical protein DYI37_04710 [Fulvimarina endophytica]|uniref:Uncharacterized protein n=1 Tax=Fulvimarina endophytica TaxID=2293836 RepID=A0A371X7H4_9HYPH|nr:hypothetical protein [Fulvimarina endophytica]RFC65156.1 hypothetical protein DYI37_04710 [Fulvimarina endophytica]